MPFMTFYECSFRKHFVTKHLCCPLPVINTELTWSGLKHLLNCLVFTWCVQAAGSIIGFNTLLVVALKKQLKTHVLLFWFCELILVLFAAILIILADSDLQR